MSRGASPDEQSLGGMLCCFPPLTGGWVFDIGNKEAENVVKQAFKQGEERLLLNKGGRNQRGAKRSSKQDELHVRKQDEVIPP
jgi:hypothetical protein